MSLTDQDVLSRLGVASSTFACIQSIDVDKLTTFEPAQVSSVLPFLAKLLLNPYFTKRKQVLKLLYHHSRTNDIIQLMQVKPTEISSDDNTPRDVIFESGTLRARLQVVVKEFSRIQEIATSQQGNVSLKLQKSWLLDDPLYAEDVALCLYTLLNKPANLLEMCEALLHVKWGPNYIAFLVGNSPERCFEVCHYLITLGERLDEGAVSNEISDQRARAIRMLCQMTPRIGFRVQRVAVQLETMPSLTIMIAVDQLERCFEKSENLEDSYESALAFITGILLGEEESTRTWFAQYLKSAQKRIEANQPTILSRFREIMLNVVQKLQLDDPDECPPKLIPIIATCKYFCAIRGAGIKLDNEENEALLRLITSKLPASKISIIFATVGICTLLVCSSMIHNQKDEKRAADWLKWLIRESGYNDATYSGHGRCSISELLLLIAIHFQNNLTNQVAELVCATLGMKLQIKASVSKCKSLFVHEVFNDQMIAEHAVKVPVTNGLDNTLTEFLPIHCIHQLLESRSFSKHQVPIHSWIYKQICQSKKPIHHMLPRLIEAYVNSLVVSTSVHGHCGINQPIPSDHIKRIFQKCLYDKSSEGDKEEDIRPKKKAKRAKKPEPTEDSHDDGHVEVIDYEAAQVLMLYYLTLYEDVRLKKSCDLGPADRAQLIRYDSEFMLEIPVFYLMQLVRDNQDMFGTILPYILKLFATQYPHLCSVQHWLNTTKHYEPNVVPTAEVYITCWHNILALGNNPEHQRVVKMTTKLWWKLNTIFPRKLWVMTTNSLRRLPESNASRFETRSLEHSWSELVADPLIVLRCDSRLFRCPPVLNILLHVLNGFLAASKRSLQDHIQEQSTRQRDNRNLGELRTTLVLAQTSAAIQILLESCIPSDAERMIINKRDSGIALQPEEQAILDLFSASVDCICDNLHQVFIADTNLAKLVHFQTYPSELLATTSNKIPSMHICLDFIPELLSQPDLSRQVFVIELTSYLCEKYAITKSLNVAKLCFNVAYTLLQLLPSDKRAIFYIPVLPALLRICRVFPILQEDAKIILSQINQITIAHMASTSSRLSLGSAQPFDDLDKMSWLEVDKLMRTLDLNEALFLCIQKCLLDTCELAR